MLLICALQIDIFGKLV